ncbi:MAG: hypothetical protein ACHQ4H_03445, partial [Ktedonobacterales bacterium]
EPPHSSFAHMVAGCDLPDGNSLTAMNPWGGFYQTQPRAWWQERIAHCAYRSVWSLARKAAPPQPAKAVVPAGWHDDGTTLTAANGQRVVLGFRAYVLEHPWDAADVPLEAERHVETLSWGDPALGAGTRQMFARTALRWTQQDGVRAEPALGAELLAVEQRLASAETQLAVQGTAGQAIRALASALAATKGG